VEDVHLLLKVDDLQCVMSRYIDGTLNERKSTNCSAYLIYPIYQSPIPSFYQKWELLQQAAQETLLENPRIRRRDSLLEPPQSKFTTPPFVFLCWQ
jgi:hypothetical protein